MHAFLTHMRAKPGKRDEVICLTTGMLEQTQTEDGIPIYVFSTAKDSPDDFYYSTIVTHLYTPRLRLNLQQFLPVLE